MKRCVDDDSLDEGTKWDCGRRLIGGKKGYCTGCARTIVVFVYYE